MKIKLRDMTFEQYEKWLNNNCRGKIECEDCPFFKAHCFKNEGCWIHNKEFYSDKFLDQEIEIEPILTDEEREYLKAVIKPFRSRVESITKYGHIGGEYIEIELDYNRLVFEQEAIWLPIFKKDTMYKDMELKKKYTLEELGLW